MPNTRPPGAERQATRTAVTRNGPATPPAPATAARPRAAVSFESLAKLRKSRDALAAAALERINTELSWYAALPAEDRSWVKLVAQNGIAAFIAWCERPENSGHGAAEIFAVAPPELTRTISLQHTWQLVRACVDVVEEYSPSLSADREGHEIFEAVLRYSREVAFSAAEVYARAAETRGSWDARLEALLVDGLIRGEAGDSLSSRAAALGWTSTGATVALVGSARAQADELKDAELRRMARKSAAHSLVSIQTDRVLVLLSGQLDDSLGAGPRGAAGRLAGGPQAEMADDLEGACAALVDHIGPGPVVIGPVVETFAQAATTVHAALAGLSAVAAWPDAPRPVQADDLLPERVLAGDSIARQTLIDSAYRPLVEAGGELVGTLNSYVGCGRSLEAAARQLFVHPNTVRYRLKRIAEVCGWDPANPREAHVLATALAVGRLAEAGITPR